MCLKVKNIQKFINKILNNKKSIFIYIFVNFEAISSEKLTNEKNCLSYFPLKQEDLEKGDLLNDSQS